MAKFNLKNEKSGKDYFSGEGKHPPSAAELEMSTLGAMIIDSACIETAINMLDSEMFYLPEHCLIFTAITEIYSSGGKVDMLTVARRLAEKSELEKVGGAYYVSQLVNTIGSGAHIEYHCRIILQKHLMRKLIVAGHEIVNAGFDESADVIDSVTRSEKMIAEIMDVIAGKQSLKNFTEIVDLSMSEAYRRADAVKNGITTGISTGLCNLDARILGWEKSNLIILAGRPGQGKSAMMLHFAKAAARRGVPVVIFSLEMSAVSLADRLLLSFADVAAYKFRSGFISRDEFYGLNSAAEQLKMLPLTIDDSPVVSIQHIRAKARALKRLGKCDMVFIDYLQLIKMDVSQGKNVNNAIAEISREAKILAKELNIPVMLLSQLNRDVERRADKRPQLADIRDSGAVEQDADIVIFVYRPAYYGLTEAGLSQNAGVLSIAKFREGAVGDVFFAHNSSLTQIFDYGEEVGFEATVQPTQTDLPF